MSHYETAEQRQIRQLRDRMNRELRESDANTRKLQQKLEKIKSERSAENLRFQQTIRNLQDSAYRDRQQFSNTIRNLDNEIKERERIQQQQISKMEIQHNDKLQKLKSDFRQEHNNLSSKIDQTRSEMKQSIKNLRNEVHVSLNEQKAENKKNIENLKLEFNKKVQEVDGKVNNLVSQISNKEEEKHELADYWAQEASRLLNEIKSNFRKQLMDKRKLQVLERSINQAHDDIKNELYSTSITVGRNAFYTALEMKEDLVLADFEWNYWLNAVKERESQLMEELNDADNRVYTFTVADETIEYNNGIDYWTNDQLKICKIDIAKVSKLLSNTENMTTEDLQNADQQLRSLQEQLALIENAASINAAMSVSRYETAQKIGNILDSNYEMIESDGDFFANEDREEYHAIFQNPVTNDQIGVVITPIPDDSGIVSNHIELIVGNADNDPLNRDRIGQKVAEALRNSGLEGCSFPCVNQYVCNNNDNTRNELERVGNISAVSSGDENTRGKVPNNINSHENSLINQKKIQSTSVNQKR